MKIESTRPTQTGIGRLKPLTLALALASSAHAALPVTITNPGFEAPATADGIYTPTATGWSNVNSAFEIGVFNVDTDDFTAQAPEGVNVGYVFGGVVDAGLAQVLTANLLADATYNLSVKVGNSKSFAYDGYRVQLLAGGTVLNEDNNTLSPASDTFVTSTVNYVYNAGLHAGLVGQPLEIRLLGKGQSGGELGETEFDDVQLTVTLGNPLAIAGGPYSVAYTGSLSLNGSSSQPSEGQTLTTYEWDLSNPPDGIYDVSGVTPASITYATLQSTYGMVVGANTIRLRVTDDSSPTPKTDVTTGTVNLAVGPPANDNFANAIDLTGVGVGQTGGVTAGTQTGTDSISATLEAGEPSPGAGNTNSVWFKWTSPADGDFTFQTNGSTTAGAAEWDSVIGIYTGASLNALTPLGQTPKDTGFPETMTIPITLGTTYYIQLTGYQGQGAANILLTWNATVNQANILSFGPGGVISPVVANAANIAWQVPFGSNFSTLAPTFTLSPGASCTVDGNPAVSGATVDFSGGPKNFVVTSQDSSLVNTYTVTVTEAPPPTDGTWITDGNGNWSDTANWAGGPPGIIAQGTGATAFFTANISAARTVTLDTARTIGNITFTDSTTSSHDLTISGSNPLTLDVTTGTPEINVTQTGNRQLSINCVITGADGLKKSGPGILNLGGNNTYTGTTTVTDGLLNFGATNLDGMGGGPGSRDISVAANKLVQRTHSVLNAAFMKRLVETTDEFAVCLTGSGAADVGTGNTVDFSSSTNGANLPNAFLASFATNGAQCRYNGTVIPASDNYRLGFPGTNGALSMIQPLVDVGGTPRGLIVGGASPVLVADNTFTGDTVLRSGRLFLGRQLALQNSALNVGNGAGDGITGQICFLASNSGGATQGQLTDAPTLGGLIGARNLASIYNSANQNNTTRLAIGDVLGLTLDVDTGKTFEYAGNARLSFGMYLTKTGDGTQILSGASDYTGNTTVGGGTLKTGAANALGFGGRQTTITGNTIVNSGFTLDLNGSATVNEPLVLNGAGIGGNGALVNSNTGATAVIGNGIAGLALPQLGTGSGYGATAPTITISGTGSGATATVTRGLTTASITSITAGGTSGYAIGDTFAVTAGGGLGAIATVTSVNGSGQVTGLSITTAGTGYTAAPTGNLVKLTGAGTGTVTISGNALNFTVSGLTMTNAGTGYTGTPSYTFSSGTASGLDVTATLSSVVLAGDSSIGGAGSIAINAVVSESGGARALTKVGAGTLTLTGANTYTGATSVTQGTLGLVGGSQSSAITVSSGASLDFTLGSPTTSTKSVDMTNGTVKITGTVNNVDDYKLMTATLGFTFTNLVTQLHAPITDYELELQNSGTELWLVYTGAPTGYAAWQAANSTAGGRDEDHDGDGVDNGTEHFLGGTANTTGFTALPGVTNTLGTLSVTWTKAASYTGTYGTDYVVETSATLAGPWTVESSPGNVTITGNDVKYTFPAPLGAKNFARLKVTGP